MGRAWFGRRSESGTQPCQRARRLWASRQSPFEFPLYIEELENRLLPSLTPTLLLNIDLGQSHASGFCEVDGLAYFSANDGTHGFELWQSNGTTAGTVMVKDINPGKSTSYPGNMMNVNGTLFFSANDGPSNHGIELWESNGTAAGTFLVDDINAGGFFTSYPRYPTNVNGTLFFQASDGTYGHELWESNGSAAGTFLVKDINPGQGSSYPKHLVNVNGTLFFSANEGTQGAEIWESNGTAAGTVLVKDIDPGTSGPNPRYLANENGTLFFSANDGTHGPGLWKTNGTAAGTVLIGAINPGVASGFYPYMEANVNGTVFISANDGTHGEELWASNGDAAGTFLVKDIIPGLGGSYPIGVNVNGTLFFTADGPLGSQLWTSNGTAAGTSQVVGAPAGHFVTNVNGTVFFVGFDGTHGGELWTSDGTAAGTFLVADIVPGANGSLPYFLTNVNGILFFETTGGGTFDPWALRLPSASSTAISSSPNPSVFGQTVTFTATVVSKNGLGTPSGAVDFAEGTVDLTPGGVALSGGVATFTVSSLSAGSHTITATYASDPNFYASRGDNSLAPQVVASANTTTTITGATTAVFGQTVTYTATLSAVSPGSGAPTGTVTFTERSTTLARSVSVTAAQATFTTSTLGVGTHTITASYSGDANFNTSTGVSAALVVARASTNVGVNVLPASPVFGQRVTLTATVMPASPGAGNPTGTVAFTEGALTLASNLTITAEKATFTTASLATGMNTIAAAYSGDGDFLGKTQMFSETVAKASAHIALSTSVDPSAIGQTITLLASVNAVAPGAGLTTGSIVFNDMFAGTSISLGTVSLNAFGVARLAFSGLAAGNHTITAVYGGDNHFTAQNLPSYTEVVQQSGFLANLQSSSGASAFGQLVTFTASERLSSGTAASGTVTFQEGGTTLGLMTLNSVGRATISTGTLSVGNHTIFAIYRRTGATIPSNTLSFIESVAKASTSTTVTSSPNPASQHTTVTLTATIRVRAPGGGQPAGSLIFRDGAAVLGSGPIGAGGVATFTTSTLNPGVHTITASYAGTTNYNGSISAPILEAVNPSAPSTSVIPPAATADGSSLAGATQLDALSASVIDAVLNPIDLVQRRARRPAGA
jgi:ELWxxDGT repeat protein